MIYKVEISIKSYSVVEYERIPVDDGYELRTCGILDESIPEDKVVYLTSDMIMNDMKNHLVGVNYMADILSRSLTYYTYKHCVEGLDFVQILNDMRNKYLYPMDQWMTIRDNLNKITHDYFTSVDRILDGDTDLPYRVGDELSEVGISLKTLSSEIASITHEKDKLREYKNE